MVIVKGPGFIRRFLLHILPDGLVRIRHFGFLANRSKKQSLARRNKIRYRGTLRVDVCRQRHEYKCYPGSGEPVIELFRDVLLICNGMGLIGREMFAVDGCKLPSNAYKEWSGTEEELKKSSKRWSGALFGD